MPGPRRGSDQRVNDALRARHPSVLLSAHEDAASITLEKLIVPAGVRGRGLGSAVMRDLIAYADMYGKRIRLTPSGAFGSSPRRLAKFYSRFGFVRNAGARRDPACRESMYRDPVARHRALDGRRFDPMRAGAA
jgi:GNAT superfamily N-acetyltransferase